LWTGVILVAANPRRAMLPPWQPAWSRGPQRAAARPDRRVRRDRVRMRRSACGSRN